MNVGEIGMAVAAPGRRADRNEHRIRLGHRRGQIGGEIEPPRLHIGRDHRIEARLENRDLAPAQAAILSPSLSTQVTWWPKSAKARAGNQPHIARANHGDPHKPTCPQWLTTSEFGGVLDHFSQGGTGGPETRHAICMNKGE